MFEHDYRVCFPRRRVYITRNHQWAFAAWAMAKQAGWIGPRTTLLHVDAHLDDTWDGVVAPGLQHMNDVSDYMRVAGELEIDNFIWAGFAARLIDRIIYVCPKEADESDPFDLSNWNMNGEQLKPVKEILAERDYAGERFESIAEFKAMISSDSDRLRVFEPANSVILDLDLDVFKADPSDPANVELKPDRQIREELEYLRDLYSYDLITVALSPAFCGGDGNCERLYRLFLEVFGLDLAVAEKW
ncbi:UPF0489 family protein [Cohnella herbarum]|uniref:Arginase family protein n=1 Tax=Cohnella herbarum TaxID=2728023 RepID=A0A7Z2ZJY0_9BACL|nr:UPF0489 family protein [Cohnella herbarum]QJD82641.1 hypothetical protein HH215_05170 [Cohnella herbarum]